MSYRKQPSDFCEKCSEIRWMEVEKHLLPKHDGEYLVTEGTTMRVAHFSVKNNSFLIRLPFNDHVIEIFKAYGISKEQIELICTVPIKVIRWMPIPRT